MRAKAFKQCHYLRPQKKRGPAQGYRNALHTMRQSAAAWGVALNLIPSLGPVIEGYIKGSKEGRRLAEAVKDPQQQEFFIQAWQQSGVFKAFFGEEEAAPDEVESPSAPQGPPSLVASLESPVARVESAPLPMPSPFSPSHGGTKVAFRTIFPETAPAPLSVSDIVAQDAVRS